MLRTLTVVLVAVLAFVACNPSPEERELARLDGDLTTAVQRYRQAGRAAAMGGVDSTGDADRVRQEIDQVEARAREIAASASTDAVKEKAGRLQEKVAAARQDLGLR